MGVMLPHFLSNHSANTLRVRQNVVVPEAQYAIALSRQEGRPADFFCRPMVMLATIDLDGQLGFVADEIDDEPSDRHLTEHSPQLRFRVRQLAL